MSLSFFFSENELNFYILPGETIHLPVYVEAVLKESLRKYPVATRSTRLCDVNYVLPKEVLNKRDSNFSHKSALNNKVWEKDLFCPKGELNSLNC